MAEPHFVVLRKEQIGRLTEGDAMCPSAAVALDAARARTAGDKEPRYVVQVLHLVEVDPKPNLIVTDLVEVPNA